MSVKTWNVLRISIRDVYNSRHVHPGFYGLIRTRVLYTYEIGVYSENKPVIDIMPKNYRK